MSEENNFQVSNQTTVVGNSEKSFRNCFLLFQFLGFLGAHRFYVGKTGSAILYLITFGGRGIWAIVDFFTIITGNFKDNDGKFIRMYVNSSKEKSNKDLRICLLLFKSLGILGAHRFYVGKIGSAILYTITLGGLDIWATIDYISLLSCDFTDNEGKFVI